MNSTAVKNPEVRKSHTPLVPQQEIKSDFQAISLFIPMAVKYLARHLTIGSFIRLRRVVLRRFKRVYYV